MTAQVLTLWRISAHEALDGIGAYYRGGRWNTPGHHLVYLAETPAGAMLETIVHLSIDSMDLPDYYRLLEVEFLINSPASTLDVSTVENWQSRMELTQRIGDQWLDAAETALARIPSAIMPHTWNYLLNPAHPDAEKVRIKATSDHLYDPRLLRVRTQ